MVARRDKVKWGDQDKVKKDNKWNDMKKKITERTETGKSNPAEEMTTWDLSVSEEGNKPIAHLFEDPTDTEKCQDI